MSSQLPKAYNAKEYEDKIYQKWEKSGFFNPDVCVRKKVTKEKAVSFTISMPPPNATGLLHVGHTLGLALQDIMIRYHRMKGDKTLWVPGVDHAAIATQNVVEKILKKEGTSRHKLGREKFLRRVEEYVQESRKTIEDQTRKMGSSCDWSRERYTMDEGLTKAVQTQFINMYNDGLIYRGDRIVNWCPRCASTLADDEVEYKKEKTKLWTFKYDKKFPIEIATTRPETKLGDTAVAVNPEDKRYKKYIGKTFKIDFLGRKLNIKIIGDKEVDMEYGTGALGVTPGHSKVDFEMGEKNKLEIIKVIGEDGRMTEAASKFKGLKVREAREQIVEALEKEGLISKTENIEHDLSICYRCGTAVEPLTSLQWFIDVNKKFKRAGEKTAKSIKERSIEVVKKGEIKIIPDRFSKVYYHWMDNLRDWCISRQIWFGHRIPVWYRDKKTIPRQSSGQEKQENNPSTKLGTGKTNDDAEIKVQIEKPGNGWAQDPDTLDTWFSSGLWTFSTLGWPDDTKDLKTFHPTSVMETMHDILFFWVARMIIMSLYASGEVPFKTVYLHGMVCDKHGKKMSKSNPKTCIEPVSVSEKYGTDALRLSLLVGNSAGNSLNLSEEKIAGYRNFVNKIWNISRFILSRNNAKLRKQCETTRPTSPSSELDGGRAKMRKTNLTLADRWILSEMNKTVGEVTKGIEEFQFSRAGEILYEFTWTKLADWYLEVAKVPAYAPAGASADKESDKSDILIHILTTLLKLWHPFTPYVTEEIWGHLNEDMLMVAAWPEVDKKLIEEKSVKEFEKMQELVTKIRNMRAEKKIAPKEIIKVKIKSKEYKKLVDEQKEVVCGLGRCEIVDDGEEIRI